MQGAQGEQVKQAVQEKTADAAGTVAGKILPAAVGLAEAATGAVLLLAMGAYFATEPEIYRRRARLLVPRRFEQTYDEL